MKKIQEFIINLFRKNIFLKSTIRQISVTLKKDYPNIYNSIKELEDEKILNLEKFGNSIMCSLNMDQKTISLLAFLDEQEAFNQKIPHINKILDFKDFYNDILIVTGSYASGKQTKVSDLDLVLITKEKAFEKQKLIDNLTSLMLPKIHTSVFTYNDFIAMLLDKKPNFGKEIFNNRLIFRNTSNYYILIKEAIENGFRG
jgi:predicted nucleotidyltransferase